MARTTTPLNNTQINNSKPRDKEYNLADGAGLYLRIKPNSSKLWLLNYRKPFTGKRVNISLGSYPTVSLAVARNTRQAMLELLSQDIDPAENRDEERLKLKQAHEDTLESVFNRWLVVKKTKVTADYLLDIERSMLLHVLPYMGKIPLHKIRATDAIATLQPVAAKGSLETIKRLCQRLNEVMIFGVNTGIIENNPLAGIKSAFGSPQRQNLPTLKPEQLPELMLAISNASIRKTTQCLIEWQLHTMVRPSEAAGARWDEIDIEHKAWSIPASRMKRKRPHVVPLTQQTLKLLEVLKPISGNREFLFPSERNPRSHTHFQTANMAIKRMGFHGKLVAHGLRALASTTLNSEGKFTPDIIEAALAHTDSNQVRAAYNRSVYLEQRRELMEWWSEKIENAAIGNLSISARIA